MKAIADELSYAVIGFIDKTKMATFSKYGYGRLRDAQKEAEDLIQDGYEEVIIRQEYIDFRSDTAEFSTSWPIITYTPRGVVPALN